MAQFYVGDKVVAADGVAEVVGLGKVVDFPEKGPARKVYWQYLAQLFEGPIEWSWDFELEAW